MSFAPNAGSRVGRGAVSSTTSLSTALSTVDGNQSTSLSQISSSLSGAISSTTSLSTAAGTTYLPLAGGTMTGLTDINVGGVTFPSVIPADGLRLYRAAAATVRIASDAAASFAAYRFSADATGPGSAFIKGRGTTASPSPPVTNDALGLFSAFGVNAAGTALIGSGNLGWTLTDPSVSDSNRGTTFNVMLAPNSSTTTATVLSVNNETGLSTNGAVTIDQNRLFRLRQYTVATLPTAGTVGRVAAVSDALAPGFLTIVVGGGTVKAPVYDNGTNWVAF